MDTIISFVSAYDTNVILGATCFALLWLIAMYSMALSKVKKEAQSRKHDLSLANTQLQFAKEDAACRSANVSITLKGLRASVPTDGTMSCHAVERIIGELGGNMELESDYVEKIMAQASEIN